MAEIERSENEGYAEYKEIHFPTFGSRRKPVDLDDLKSTFSERSSGSSSAGEDTEVPKALQKRLQKVKSH